MARLRLLVCLAAACGSGTPPVVTATLPPPNAPPPPEPAPAPKLAAESEKKAVTNNPDVSNRDGVPQLYLGEAAKATAPPVRLVSSGNRVALIATTPDGKAAVFTTDH